MGAAQDIPESPPSYDEIIRQDTQAGSSSGPGHSGPQSPQSPANGHQSTPSTDPNSPNNPNNLYTANLSLPWRYPRGEFCNKCRNTGYKIKNGKRCSRCWRSYEKGKWNPVNVVPRPAAPARPKPNIVTIPPGNYIPLHASPYAAPGAAPPRIVMPGDPAIGGTLCPSCRGRGLVSFFLDEETCRRCNGIGRVF